MSNVRVGQVWRYKTGDYVDIPWSGPYLVLGHDEEWIHMGGQAHWLILELETGDQQVSTSLVDPATAHLHWERIQ